MLPSSGFKSDPAKIVPILENSAMLLFFNALFYLFSASL